MRIAFIFGSPKISGGSYVIFQHAAYLKEKGHQVHLVTLEKITLKPEDIWHDAMRNLDFISISEAGKNQYDICIATWWMSPFHLHKLNAKQYSYFVQSIEAYFSEDADISNQYLAHESYNLGLPVITEALWIKEDLEKRFHSDVFFVENGIRKDIYSPNGNVVDARPRDGLRVLVEGSVTSRFKNIARTVDAVKASGIKDVWLLTPSDINSYPHVSRVLSNIPITKVADVYRSCDILVKHSFVEGMFGPPLEMFHCGGTAVVSNVTGFDQYIKDDVNALVTNVGSFHQITDALVRLKQDPALVQRLKQGALETAAVWPDWPTQSALFEQSLLEIMELPKVDRVKLAVQIRHALNIYELMKISLEKHFERKIEFSSQDDAARDGETPGEAYYRRELSRPLLPPTKITRLPELDRSEWLAATQRVKPAASNYEPLLNVAAEEIRVFGLSISNEHIEEMWHPIVSKAGWKGHYVCSRPKGYFNLYDLPREEVPDEIYSVFDWINEPTKLFDQIRACNPNVILFHNGNHPAYQGVLAKLRSDFNIPIVFSELGWFPQKHYIHFDADGTNGSSSICASTLENLVGRVIKSQQTNGRPLKHKTVLLALQLENDTNSIVFSRHFRSNKQLIEHVLSNVPSEFRILIKAHPLDHTGHRYEEFLDGRSQMVSDPIDELLAKADAVVAINSTVLLEALAYNLNIYFCGEALLNNKQIGFAFDSADRPLASVWQDKIVNEGRRRKAFVEYLKSRQINLAAVPDMDASELLSNPSVAIITEAAQQSVIASEIAKPARQTLPEVEPGKRLIIRSTAEAVTYLNKYKLISFDVFDTLLVRDIYSPEDVFTFAARHAQNLIKDSKFDHRDFRIRSEQYARKSSPHQDVTIDEIYSHYLLMTGVAADIVEEIKRYEIETEGKFLRARESAKMVFNSARSQGLNIVIMSDFYMSGQVIRRYLESAGYDLSGVRLFVSSELGLSKKDGHLYDHVAQTMGVAPGEVLHFGDNFVVDTKMALKHGVHSIHIASPKVTLDLAPKLKDYLAGVKQNQVGQRSLEWSFMLGGVINGLFDDHFAPRLDSAFAQNPYRFGYAVLGPLLASYTSWLRAQVEQNPTDVLLFLARDGWVMKDAFDAYQRIVPLKKDVPTQYIAASRRMMDIMALADDFENVTRIVNARYTSGKLSEFLSIRLGVESHLITDEVLSAGGFSSANELVSLPRDKVRTLKVIQRLKAPIQENAATLAALFKRYIADHGVKPDTTVGVVDIGYFGTMQKVIAELLRPMNTDVYGLYLAVRREAQLDPEVKGKMAGYLANSFDPRDGREPLYIRKLAVMEQFFSAPHTSVSNLKEVDGKIEVEYLSDIGEQFQYDRLNAIHKGAVDFVRCMAELEARLGERLDLEVVQHGSTLDGLFSRHEPEVAQILAGMIFENRVNGEGAQMHYSNPPVAPQAPAAPPKKVVPPAQKPASAAAPAKPVPAKSVSTAPKRIGTGDLITALTLKNGAVMDSRGRIEVLKGSRGWVVYGPYMSLSAGNYQLFVEYDCTGPSAMSFKKPGTAKFEVSTGGGERVFATQAVKLSGKQFRQECVLSFRIPQDGRADDVEVRIRTNGKADLLVTKVLLDAL